MHAVILAGGRGTRLGDLTLDLPKPMVPVANRPFLEHVLDCLVDGNIGSATLCVGYKAEVIQRHFGSTYRRIALDYSIERHPLGTGGAMANAMKGVGKEPMLVMNGDTLLKVNLSEFVEWYERDPVPIAMVLRQMEDVTRFGTVIVQDDRVLGFAEKSNTGPGLINAGVYIVQPAVFQSFNLSGVFGFEADLLQRHCRELRPRAFLTSAYFIDIGLPADLERARTDLHAPSA